MHELGLMQNIVDVVREHAEKNGSRRVTKIMLEVGALSGAVPESLRFYLDVCTKNTIVEGAQLEITAVPAQAKCRGCGDLFEVLKNNFACPHCKSENWELVSGKELTIQGIEVAE
jgi:hydrogenase nickel incorporation protein HypA/HybF